MESGRYKGVLDELELGVGVRTDFAVQVDLFVLRGNPFHERRSLREINDKREHSTSEGIEEGGKTLIAAPESRGRSRRVRAPLGAEGTTPFLREAYLHH